MAFLQPWSGTLRRVNQMVELSEAARVAELTIPASKITDSAVSNLGGQRWDAKTEWYEPGPFARPQGGSVYRFLSHGPMRMPALRSFSYDSGMAGLHGHSAILIFTAIAEDDTLWGFGEPGAESMQAGQLFKGPKRWFKLSYFLRKTGDSDSQGSVEIRTHTPVIHLSVVQTSTSSHTAAWTPSSSPVASPGFVAMRGKLSWLQGRVQQRLGD